MAPNENDVAACARSRLRRYNPRTDIMTQSPDTGEEGKAAPLAIWSALATVYVGANRTPARSFKRIQELEGEFCALHAGR
ncbi:MAG TPA: hypothetical protein VFV82_11545 [Candidatus Binatia bacterium]|nr:hypothetical protein [Candidatus Binatia bacterium]